MNTIATRRYVRTILSENKPLARLRIESGVQFKPAKRQSALCSNSILTRFAQENRDESMPRKDFRVLRDKFANDSGLPFGRLLRREHVLRVLDDENHKYRQGVYCPLVTLWAWLSQCLSQDKSLNEAVMRIVANRVTAGLPACSASSASYSNARTRFPLAVMKRLAKEIGRNVHDNADDSWHWRGRDVYLADGTGLSMPDTPENQLAYPQSKTVAPGVGFPTLRAVALISLSTGAVTDFAFARQEGKGTGEASLLRGMLDSMKRDDLLIADKYYPSYVTVSALNDRGIDMVSISHASRPVDFTQGIRLSDTDHIVEWKKPKRSERISLEDYKKLPDVLRVREFILNVVGRDGRREQLTVVSTITDPTIPQSELSDLYWQRWNCEVDFRSIKQSMHLDILRCKTPEMVSKEIHAHLLAWNLLRGVMTESAKRNGLKPRQLSVKGAMQSVESFTPAMMATESGEVLYNAFLATVAAHRVGNRPGRQEPRVKKRRSGWHAMMTKPRNQYRRKLTSDR